MNLSPLEIKLLAILKAQEDAVKAEEDYRWNVIGQYPNIPVTPEIREEWLSELDEIADKQRNTIKYAQEILKQYTKESE